MQQNMFEKKAEMSYQIMCLKNVNTCLFVFIFTSYNLLVASKYSRQS